MIRAAPLPPDPLCPACGQPRKRRIADVPPKAWAAPITRYVLEHRYGIKRMNGGFV